MKGQILIGYILFWQPYTMFSIYFIELVGILKALTGNRSIIWYLTWLWIPINKLILLFTISIEPRMYYLFISMIISYAFYKWVSCSIDIVPSMVVAFAIITVIIVENVGSNDNGFNINCYIWFHVWSYMFGPIDPMHLA